jgi:predicted O-methyltransferase YrrM
MNNTTYLTLPTMLEAIEEDTQALGFELASDRGLGSLLRTLAASKPGGNFLELGTGTGMSAAWILDGMDEGSTLLTVERDEEVVAIAKRHLGRDARLTFYVGDGRAFLANAAAVQYDFIFADAWAGKYTELEQALSLLKGGGLYIVDDMLPQPSWPDGHAAKASKLISTLEQRKELLLTKISWSSGIIIATKKH